MSVFSMLFKSIPPATPNHPEPPRASHPEPASPRTTPPPRAGLEISRLTQAVTHLEPKKLANGRIGAANDHRKELTTPGKGGSLAPSPIWYQAPGDLSHRRRSGQAHIWRSLSPSSRSLRRGA
uniref:Uncharacterized protein n=1 Tax=Fagus sylvatica TaxID=28930 RepID=A0A2N9GLL6_FAGSY